MSNPYSSYYIDQVGTGIASFQGVRFQRGHGFFGRLFSGIGSFIKELAPSVFKRALPSAIGFAQDVMSGENLGKSAKTRLIEAGKSAADETLDKLKTKLQKGSGINRFRRKGNSRYFKIRKSNKKKVNKKRKTKKFK